eukprot:452330-Alexandrium_andersonii.AAC.1
MRRSERCSIPLDAAQLSWRLCQACTDSRRSIGWPAGSSCRSVVAFSCLSIAPGSATRRLWLGLLWAGGVASVRPWSCHPRRCREV